MINNHTYQNLLTPRPITTPNQNCPISLHYTYEIRIIKNKENVITIFV